ncbi:AFG1/ZapE family ATPase [Dietzia sp.]|uniref:AFG1/ZapE family ATPase n=1 Tax=Dietzia sp. TaxID=1871616 RepID=UPI002FDB6EB5
MWRTRASPGGEVSLPAGISATEHQARAIHSLSGAGNVYLFGPPGSGKTTLLDAVHAANPGSVRKHFGAFYRELHAALPGVGRSVPRAVAELTERARLVCFDELHLHDVADSLYLAAALDHWEDAEVRVVATSNYRPAELLPNPLLHDAALPVIRRIRRPWRGNERSG